MMLPLFLFGAAGLALFLWASSRDETDGRTINLVRGKRYAISHRIMGPGWDASMYPGFCNFSSPVVTGQGSGPVFTEVQFTAEWCANNMVWSVPNEIAIAEM